MRDIDTYLSDGLDAVPGWLSTISARFIADLADIQHQAGMAGAVGEIGIYRGKLFLVLHLSCSAREKSFAIDVFTDQHLNPDGSGSGVGDKSLFLANVARWGGDVSDIVVMQRSSMDVRPQQILDAVGACRLVSIDGGHTAECTLNDLTLVEGILQERGMVVIDDCFNEDWPDVSIGVAKYMFDPATRLRPFAISPGKLYLARSDDHAFYRQATKERSGAIFLKTARMFGFEVEIFTKPPPKPEAKAE